MCSYASSNNAKFKSEGEYGIEIRDSTWIKLIEILNEIESDTRPLTTPFQDIERELPEMKWPEE